jgi:predicted nucleic acid-binding protein
MSKVFIDTNILVYALDSFDPAKQKRCRNILRRVNADPKGVISTQVMQEFYVTATGKLGTDPLIAKDLLNAFERFEVVIVTPEIIKEAIDIRILNRLSFWDALIVAAAQSARCDRIWTEDLNDGQIIRGVQVENPIKENDK